MNSFLGSLKRAFGTRSGNQKTHIPSLEFRIPISPRDSDMRMLRYLLESIQEYGGPIGRAAHCVVSVGADEPPRDLAKEYEWTADHSVEFHWVDQDLFRRWTYDATGFDRFWIESDADIIAQIDADLLVTGDFDALVTKAHQEQKMLGFMAHVSPFGVGGSAQTTSEAWWRLIFDEAGMPTPNLDQQYSGWGLDWDTIYPEMGIVSKDPNHRFGPHYFNYGVVIGPRIFFERMAETYVDDLKTVTRVIDSGFRSQITNCLAFERHKIPCGTFPINYNFPLNVPGDAIRELNPDPNGENGYEDIRIFHYIGGRENFETPESVRNLLSSTDLPAYWRAFQSRLEVIKRRIAET